LNPGFIRPSAFYNTTDPAQSKFNYGMKAFQTGPTFNDVLYNTNPNAPDTPYGLQQMAKPLTMQEINDLILGKGTKAQTVAPATRRVPITDANRNVMNFDYSKVGQLPVIAPVAPSQVTPTSASTSAINAELTKQLGANWFNRQQAAAAAGDWETYYAIQRQVDAIMNPTIDKP
jgi:hypothetical protein